MLKKIQEPGNLQEINKIEKPHTVCISLEVSQNF